jgi:hypothetical protein
MRKLVILSMLVLCACKPEVEGEVYISDIYKVYKTQENLNTPIVINFPIQSANDCADISNRVLPVINQFSSIPVTLRSCEKLSGEMHDMMYLDTQITISSVDREKGSSFSGIGGIIIGKWEQSEEAPIDAYFALNSNFDSMVQAVDDVFDYQSVNVSKLEFKMKLLNDTGEPVELMTGNHFINERPVSGKRPFRVNHREEIRVMSSDVTAYSLIQDGYVWLGYIASENHTLPEDQKVVFGMFSAKKWE